MSTQGRRGKKLPKDVSDDLLKQVAVHVPDLGAACPHQAEGFIATQVVNWNKLNHMLAKMQPEIQKLIKLQTQEILESLDPSNIGKSREIKIPNPKFDAALERTDTDENPCVGENAFWMKSYESVWDRNRFRPNVIEDTKKMFLNANKDVIQEYKEALKPIYAAAEELEKAKEELKEEGANSKEKPEEKGLMGQEWFN